MPQVDISTIQTLNAQIEAVETQLQATPAGPAHDVIAAQVVGLQAQLKAATDQLAKQSDLMNNIMTGVSVLSGFGLLSGTTGAMPISTIVGFFRR